MACMIGIPPIGDDFSRWSGQDLKKPVDISKAEGRLDNQTGAQGYGRVFLVGVGCVGKTTVGQILAELLGVGFFVVDREIEAYFGTSIERLQNRYFTKSSFIQEAAKALTCLLQRLESRACVIALPPSGLRGGYLRAVRKGGGTVIVLNDRPENIVARIRFFDIDSKPVEKNLTDREKRLYCREIAGDMTYFRKSYERAHMQIDISGLDARQAANRVLDTLKLRAAGRPQS